MSSCFPADNRIIEPDNDFVSFFKFAKSGPLFEIFLELPLLTASWYNTEVHLDQVTGSKAVVCARETVDGSREAKRS